MQVVGGDELPMIGPDAGGSTAKYEHIIILPKSLVLIDVKSCMRLIIYHSGCSGAGCR